MPLSLSLVLLAALVAVLLASARRALHPRHASTSLAHAPQRWELLDEPAPLYRSRLEAVPQGQQSHVLRLGLR
jgi:hypothetical protein